MKARSPSVEWSILILPAFLVFLAHAQPKEPPLRPGITPRVVCAADPTQSYAVFIPPSYDSSRPFPILFLLDASRGAMEPLERFQDAASRLGFILASSYNSASDEAFGDPNAAALSAMWKDAASRLSLDRARSYVAGFSGTARAAFGMAVATHGKIAGVIAAGAGYPEDLSPTRSADFLTFGTVGETDFNYYEMIDLDDQLDDLGLPHRLEIFAGGHEWTPADLASEALEWLLLMGPASGDAAQDAALAGEFWDREMARARRMEAEGNLRGALRAYRSLVRDFRDRRDVSPAAESAHRLELSAALKKQQHEWVELRTREQKTLAKAWQILGSALRSGQLPPRPAQMAEEIGVPGWKRKAAGQGAEALAARRILNSLGAQTAFYLPREEEWAGNFKGAALLLSVAETIRPDEPRITYHLAADLARSGNTGEALRALERSVRMGFRDLERLQRDSDFDSLRNSARYARIEKELARLQGSSKDSGSER